MDDAKPVARTNKFGDNRWIDLHELFVAEAKDKEADVLFIGDDHIALLEQSEIFKELFAPLHCLCFGALGDRTSNLLWRIENGELDNITPKVIVVSIGGFNYGSSSAEILSAIHTIAQLISAKQPSANIFVMKLLPCGKMPNPWRDTAREVNDGLEATLSTLSNVKAIDSDPSLVGSDGSVDHHDMFDFAHLTQLGYRKTFEMVHVAVTGALNPEQ
uniref:SGNH hydrolase-type esterase domain-containing protein n=1 Tax=Plectus sambesii TaxID=2011161 RepID=A0A914ULM3_9BILA